uniref:cobaltochelatase subunit CobN n=1 Tax=Phaeovulum sp. TaxID=2934796 RepID=UPI00356B3C5D
MMTVRMAGGFPRLRALIRACTFGILTAACGVGAASADVVAPKVAVLSTAFVLPAKFRMIAEAAKQSDVIVEWRHVDTSSPDEIAAALDGADLVMIDAPRDTDIAAVEAGAGDAVRASGLPGLRVSVMNTSRVEAFGGLNADVGQQLYSYWVAGMHENHVNWGGFVAALVRGQDLAAVPPPEDLPNGGIYHPKADRIFADLSSYLEWWEAQNGARDGKAVIGMEFSSSYISDGQTLMLDEIVSGIQAKGAVPLAFYRASRLAREATQSWEEANAAANTEPVETEPSGLVFPNPVDFTRRVSSEPLITQDGQTVLDVLFVNTFIGGDPDGRKAWLQTLNVPVIHLMSYRDGDRAAYLADPAGVDAFSLPFTLTNSEYIGMQDPIMLSTVEDGQITPMPEQLELLLSKAMRLAALRELPNSKKRVAMVYWNTPEGETNMGGSNLNLPRSMVDMAEAMRGEGYLIDAFSDTDVTDRAAGMHAPRYRADGLDRLVAGEDWAFLPMRDYQAWFSSLPAEVQDRINQYWGAPEDSQWLVTRDDVLGFAIPRLQLGNLTILPQPPRGAIASDAMDDMERDLFHDDKVPVNHPYLATYLWLRQTQDALIHFGTHGSQEWTPGKERGLWAFDDPQLLAGDIPIVYPYIVDNIAEAIHVKRRGRGVVVSYQTPAFAPAGLSPDLTAINDYFREYHTVVEGPARENLRQQIIAKAVEVGFDKDLGLEEGALAADFDAHSRDLETLLEDLGAQMQPLGLHTFGTGPDTQVSMAANVMQMMGAPFYEALGVDPGEIFKAGFETLEDTLPMQFVIQHVLGDVPADPALAEWVEKGREYRDMLDGSGEISAVLTGLSAGWIDPSYGGDPIRNPDALPTGRNIYGFDPSRIPTRNAYAAGQVAIEELIATHTAEHGEAPQKLAFTMWSTETMRHLGMLEAQILYAMGVRPIWDEGGQVTGMEVIPLAELGRPRIDPVISLTGLYRDQFPNVMERFNEAIVMVNALDETPEENPLRANTARIADALRAAGIEGGIADNYALTRMFGTQSGDYGTGLPDAVM